MIGLDTNVMVRYLTHDHPAQTAAATRLIDSLSPDMPGFLSLVVLIELVWVLESSYRFKRDEITAVMEAILRSDEMVTERVDIAWQAVRMYRTTQAGFADALIERLAHAAGCDHTVTFDKNAAASAGMKLLN